MLTEKLSYHKAAGKFLKEFHENNTEDSIFFNYDFLSQMAGEAKLIAKSLSLKNMDYQNAIVATWFRYAGTVDITAGFSESMTTLLNDFFRETAYPEEEIVVVKNTILAAIEIKNATTPAQKVVFDACNSWLAHQNFIENTIRLKGEVNRLTGANQSEVSYLKYYLDLFIKSHYYTPYANQHYSLLKEKNFQLLEKRIHKLEETEKLAEREVNKLKNGTQLSNKETEDLFKIAFRNYNHLVSVADSKAALLIKVNSIIISIMLGFVFSKVEKNMFLLLPIILLLIVCIITILLSILASMPRKNNFLEDRNSHSYQKFFFGSFDLIDPSFRNASWERYYTLVNDLFNGAKEIVYIEMFKESYNVRKALAKKFAYLSLAYWVFIVGLLLSVVAFVLTIQTQTIV